MKKNLFAVVLVAVSMQMHAQDTTAQKNKMGLYTFIINIVPGGYKFPLIGFINQAQGDHTSLEAGFINTAQGNLLGLQAGFINTSGKSVTGLQAGFINTAGDSLAGAQSGFINAVKNNVLGAQFGFSNTAGGYVYGMQSGFMNVAGDSLTGLQAGFINTGGAQATGGQFGFVNIAKNLRGIQSGFSNTAAGVEGAQIGFINTARKVKGLQLGFINVADTVESGMPFGFLSIVKKGGYASVEAGISEMFPVNVLFRIGIQRFYTVLVAAYNPEHQNPFSVGSGFGAIFPLSRRFYLNPEALIQNNIGDFTQQTVSFTPHIGFMITKKLHVSVGPSVVWHCVYEGNEFYQPLFSLYSNDLDRQNRLMVGVRAGLRYNFKW